MIVLIYGITFGLVLGYFTARSSQRRDPIYGGTVAQAVHYITASTVTALPVTIIAVAVNAGLLRAILTAIGFAIVLWGSAFVFATIERPAREAALAAKANQGWTEEDARTSGL